MTFLEESNLVEGFGGAVQPDQPHHGLTWDSLRLIALAWTSLSHCFCVDAAWSFSEHHAMSFLCMGEHRCAAQ